MLPFLGKEETSLRRLEAQVQQRDCHISNLESSLAKAKSEIETLKTEVDAIQHALRTSNERVLQQEQQIERYNKELKPKKEMCTWLQQQVTYLKKEMEAMNTKDKASAVTVHQKTEEAEMLKAELQAVKRELDQMKGSLQSSDRHAYRFRAEAEAEIQRLKIEATSKSQALQLMEDSINSRELTKEQKQQLQKASSFDRINDELRRCQSELKTAETKIHQLESHLEEYTVTKTDLQRAKAEIDHLSTDCKRLGEREDERRSLMKTIDEMGDEKQSMSVMLKQYEEERGTLNERIQELTMQIQAKDVNSEGYQLTLEKLRSEIKEKEHEVSGITAVCERLQQENAKLYEHVSYSEEQLNKAKEAIDAKQGILENARAMNEGDRMQQQSMGRLVQSLRTELESSRRRISELATKDKKADDAIQSLERKLEMTKAELADTHGQNVLLDKALKSTQVEVLRVQQELTAMTEKAGAYKRRLTSLKDAFEQDKGDQNRGRLPKCPEYYTLQERVRMLEEEIVAERNSHSVTKKMLKQESEHCAAQTGGATHLSTPFPQPGSSFRFSYCRGDHTYVDNGTPQLSSGAMAQPMKTPMPSDPANDPAVDGKDGSKETLSLTPVSEGEPKRVDHEAMEIDEAVPVRFSTPRPQPTQLPEKHPGSTPERRVTMDFHQLSARVFRDYEQMKQRGE